MKIFWRGVLQVEREYGIICDVGSTSMEARVVSLGRTVLRAAEIAVRKVRVDARERVPESCFIFIAPPPPMV